MPRKFNVELARADGLSDADIILMMAERGYQPQEIGESLGVKEIEKPGFLEEWWKNANPINMVTGPINFLTNPKSSLQGISEKSRELGEQSLEAFKSGRYGEGATLLIEGLTHAFGTSELMDAVNDVQSGNISGGLGKIAGVTTSYATPGLIGKSIKGLNVKSLPGTKEALSEKVPVPMSATAESPVSSAIFSSVQEGADASILGAAAERYYNRKLEQRMQKWGEKLSSDAAPGYSYTPVNVGREGLQEANRVMTGLGEKAKSEYRPFNNALENSALVERVRQNTGVEVDLNMPVDLSGVRSTLRGYYDKLKNAQVFSNPNASAATKVFQTFMEGEKYVDLASAKEFLGALKSVTRENKSLLAGTQKQGLAAQGEMLLQQKIESTLASKAGPDALRSMKAGDELWRMARETEDFIKGFNKEPVKFFQQLTNMKDRGINMLRQAADLMPDVMPKLGQAYIKDALTKPNFSSAWDNLGAETKGLLYSPEMVKAIDSFSAVSKRVAKETSRTGMSRSIRHAVRFTALGFEIAHIPLLIWHNAAGLAAEFLMRSPTGVRLLTQGMNVAANTAAGTAYAATVMKYLSDNGFNANQDTTQQGEQ